MNKKDIVKDLLAYLKNGNPEIKNLPKIPMDESLVELGLMDSFGVVDIVLYIETKYQIKIHDDEITKEKFGSINKMVNLIFEKKK